MKEKGRNIIPWFQTAASLSLVLVVSLGLLVVIVAEILNNGVYEMPNETIVLSVFVVFWLGFYLLIKRFYFNTNRHLDYLAELQQLTMFKQRVYRFAVLASVTLLPFILFLVIVLLDKKKWHL